MARSFLGLSDKEYRDTTPRILVSMCSAYGEIKNGKTEKKKKLSLQEKDAILDAF